LLIAVSPISYVFLYLFFGGVFATLTGYIADSHGRSFWRWFGLGAILPFVSVFVVLLVAMCSQLAADRAANPSRRPGTPPSAM
jgi:MFS family permease